MYRAHFRTNRVHWLCLVLPDLMWHFCFSSLAPGAPGRAAFPAQHPMHLVRPYPLLAPPTCICLLILSSTGLLPSHCGCAPLAAISTTLPPLATKICPLPSADIPQCFFLSLHPTITSIIPLLFTRGSAQLPWRRPPLACFPAGAHSFGLILSGTLPPQLKPYTF